MGPTLPLHIQKWSYRGGGGKQGQIQEPQTKPGVPFPGGSISSFELAWVMLARQEAWSQCFSVP